MKKSVIIMFVAAVVLAIAVGSCFWYVNRDKRLVAELIENVADLAGKKSSKLPHAGVLKFSKVDDLFAQKIELRCTDPAIVASMSRDELKAIVSMMIKRIDYMEVKTGNVEINISGENATFSFDAEFSGALSGKGDAFANVYQVNGSAVKNDGRWLVTSLIAEEIVQ